MIKLTEEQIIDGQNEAYLKAGNNAYFGNGFKYGVDFTLKQVNKNEEELLKEIEKLKQLVSKADYIPKNDV